MKLSYVAYTLLIILFSLEGYSQVPTNYEMVWNDEFNGTELDATKWATCPEWNRQGEVIGKLTTLVLMVQGT